MSLYVDTSKALRRIDRVILYVENDLNQAVKDNHRGITPYHSLNIRQVPQLDLRLKHTILQMSPSGSEYWNYASLFLDDFKFESVAKLYEALKSLREDYANYFLNGFNEMVDTVLFADILEQA